jgi:hypothetical protein
MSAREWKLKLVRRTRKPPHSLTLINAREKSRRIAAYFQKRVDGVEDGGDEFVLEV